MCETGTSECIPFADIIINGVSGVAECQDQGFARFVPDSRALKDIEMQRLYEFLDLCTQYGHCPAGFERFS